jgi:hypothetical protein
MFGQNVGRKRQGDQSMRAISTWALLAIGATGVAACTSEQNPDVTTPAVQTAPPATPYGSVAV